MTPKHLVQSSERNEGKTLGGEMQGAGRTRHRGRTSALYGVDSYADAAIPKSDVKFEDVRLLRKPLVRDQIVSLFWLVKIDVEGIIDMLLLAVFAEELEAEPNSLDGGRVGLKGEKVRARQLRSIQLLWNLGKLPIRFSASPCL